jgi:hypothetical protein
MLDQVHISTLIHYVKCMYNRTIGVVISVLASSVVNHSFEPWSSHAQDYEIVFCPVHVNSLIHSILYMSIH